MAEAEGVQQLGTGTVSADLAVGTTYPRTSWTTLEEERGDLTVQNTLPIHTFSLFATVGYYALGGVFGHEDVSNEGKMSQGKILPVAFERSDWVTLALDTGRPLDAFHLNSPVYINY